MAQGPISMQNTGIQVNENLPVRALVLDNAWVNSNGRIHSKGISSGNGYKTSNLYKMEAMISSVNIVRFCLPQPISIIPTEVLGLFWCINCYNQREV